MMRTKLFAIFPLALFRRAVVLETPDGSMIGWQKEDIEAALDCMQQNHVAILGGHVLKKAEDEFYFTGMEWNISRDERNWDSYVQKGVRASLAFLESNQQLCLFTCRSSPLHQKGSEIVSVGKRGIDHCLQNRMYVP